MQSETPPAPERSPVPASTPAPVTNAWPLIFSNSDELQCSRGWLMLGVAMLLLVLSSIKSGGGGLYYPAMLLGLPALLVITVTVRHLASWAPVPGCQGCGIGCAIPVALFLASMMVDIEFTFGMERITSLVRSCTWLFGLQLALALLLLLPCWVPPRTAQDELSIQTMNRGILWVVLCLNVVLMVITRNFSYSRDHFTTVLLILGLCLSVGAGIAFASSPECRTVSSLGLAIILLGIATPGFCVFLLRDISSELSYAVLIPVVIAVALIIIGLAVERAGRVLKARAANSNDAAKA